MKDEGKARMWAFSAKAGWKEIPDFLESEKADGFAEELAQAGYTRHPSGVAFGDDVCGFSVQVHRRDSDGKGPYEFIVAVELAGGIYNVACKSVPDLFELLAKAAHIAELAVVAGDREGSKT